MIFEVVSDIENVETIAEGSSLRIRHLLQKKYGKGRWKKKKGMASVRLKDGTIRLAEVHWYEAHGIGKRDVKIKFPFLD
ncbi:MAG: hypothetical protein KBD94_03900 [Pyrinomonadaceae bacterium]|nr:hypothetical protein [Pyrinomonadaceae bacterium]